MTSERKKAKENADNYEQMLALGRVLLNGMKEEGAGYEPRLRYTDHSLDSGEPRAYITLRSKPYRSTTTLHPNTMRVLARFEFATTPRPAEQWESPNHSELSIDVPRTTLAAYERAADEWGVPGPDDPDECWTHENVLEHFEK